MLAHRWKSLALALSFGVLSTALVGASCNKASKEDAAPPKPDARPAAEEPLAGIDVSDLSPAERQQFFRILDAAPSPCGKAHSLRTSLKDDKDCRRAPFAARYVKKLAGFGGEDQEVLDFVKRRYDQAKAHTFDLTGVAYEGVPNAPVQIVEFFDYSCPHCKLAMPVLEDVVAEYPSDVVVYFMQFPLGGGGHPQSMSLAAAALAAQKQGKFREMHKKLFAAQDGEQSDDAVRAIAKGLGLDMARFEKDWKDPATKALVEKQKQAGLDADIDGTPGIFMNGRTYTDPHELEFMKSWVDEEIAVKR